MQRLNCLKWKGENKKRRSSKLVSFQRRNLIKKEAEKKRRRWGGENELSHYNPNVIVLQEEEEEVFLSAKWLKRVQVLIWILNQNLWYFSCGDLRQCNRITTLYSLGSKIEQIRQTPRLAGSFFFSLAQFDSSFLSFNSFFWGVENRKYTRREEEKGKKKM